MEQVKSNITIWIIIILLLIGGGYALGFLAYKDYENLVKPKVARFAKGA